MDVTQLVCTPCRGNYGSGSGLRNNACAAESGIAVTQTCEDPFQPGNPHDAKEPKHSSCLLIWTSTTLSRCVRPPEKETYHGLQLVAR
eukprot:6490164-Amphidinium_carterae.2